MIRERERERAQQETKIIIQFNLRKTDGTKNGKENSIQFMEKGNYFSI